jgi:hypothetical protein
MKYRTQLIDLVVFFNCSDFGEATELRLGGNFLSQVSYSGVETKDTNSQFKILKLGRRFGSAPPTISRQQLFEIMVHRRHMGALLPQPTSQRNANTTLVCSKWSIRPHCSWPSKAAGILTARQRCEQGCRRLWYQHTTILM